MSVYRLPAAVTEDNIASFADDVTTVTEQVFRAGGGRVLEAPARVAIAGHPAFTASGTSVTPSGTHVRSRVTLVFHGTTEYFFNCQFTTDQTDEMEQACQKVLDSFEIAPT